MADRSATTTLSEALRSFDHHAVDVEEFHALHKRMHAECPVGRSEQWNGFYVLSRHDDVRQAAADWQAFSSADGFLVPEPPFMVPAVGYDPPEHGFWRALFVEALNPSAVRQFEPRLRSIAVELVTAFAEKGEVDLVKALAVQLPVKAIFELLGVVDPQRMAVGRAAAEAIIEAGSDQMAMLEALGPYVEFCLAEINARRTEPRDDFLTRLATHPAGDGLLDDEGVVGVMMGFLMAGMHSTASAIAGVLTHVAQDADLRDALRDDRRLIGVAVEESMRLESPFMYFFRTTTRDVEVRGVPIPKGSKVMVSYAAANRDPGAFTDPDEFRLDRGPNAHLSFGHGLHTCVGALLARITQRVAVDVVLDRLPGLRVAEGFVPARGWDGANFISVRELQVVWDV